MRSWMGAVAADRGPPQVDGNRSGELRDRSLGNAVDGDERRDQRGVLEFK
jgi:hypothetical protein